MKAYIIPSTNATIVIFKYLENLTFHEFLVKFIIFSLIKGEKNVFKKSYWAQMKMWKIHGTHCVLYEDKIINTHLIFL